MFNELWLLRFNAYFDGWLLGLCWIAMYGCVEHWVCGHWAAIRYWCCFGKRTAYWELGWFCHGCRHQPTNWNFHRCWHRWQKPSMLWFYLVSVMKWVFFSLLVDQLRIEHCWLLLFSLHCIRIIVELYCWLNLHYESMILILSKTKLTNNPGLMLILRLECMTLLQNQDFLLIISVGRGGGDGIWTQVLFIGRIEQWHWAARLLALWNIDCYLDVRFGTLMWLGCHLMNCNLANYFSLHSLLGVFLWQWISIML